MPAFGQRMLYRPVPTDFVQVFERVGWGGIEQHYRVHARTVVRWMTICGKDGLIQMRRDYVRTNGYKRRQRRTA